MLPFALSLFSSFQNNGLVFQLPAKIDGLVKLNTYDNVFNPWQILLFLFSLCPVGVLSGWLLYPFDMTVVFSNIFAFGKIGSRIILFFAPNLEFVQNPLFFQWEMVFEDHSFGLWGYSLLQGCLFFSRSFQWIELENSNYFSLRQCRS